MSAQDQTLSRIGRLESVVEKMAETVTKLAVVDERLLTAIQNIQRVEQKVDDNATSISKHKEEFDAHVLEMSSFMTGNKIASKLAWILAAASASGLAALLVKMYG